MHILSSCNQHYYRLPKAVKDGQYDSHFPTQPTAKHLEQISKNVKHINVIARYTRYHFSKEKRMVAEGFDWKSISRSDSLSYFSIPSSGSGTVIYRDADKMMLLTCAHIIDAPDTLYTWHKNKMGIPTAQLASVAIRNSHTISLKSEQRIGSYQIIVSDAKLDAALIGFKFSEPTPSYIKPFSITVGKTRDMPIGTFSYMFGFPHGQQMVNWALVGQLPQKEGNPFLVSGAMYRGISGGPVFALRDGVPNFEMIGMVFAVGGETHPELQAEKKYSKESYTISQPYTGQIFVQNKHNVVYGLNYVLPIEQIINFIETHNKTIRSTGYNPNQFFKHILNY